MMKKHTILCLLILLITGTFADATALENIPVFTTEAQILTVSRQDQSSAIKTKMVKREVFLSEVINVLTTYRIVAKNQYMVYAHQIGVSGTTMLADGKAYTWSIEAGYAATLESSDGEMIYLLQPELKTEPAARGDGIPPPQP